MQLQSQGSSAIVLIKLFADVRSSIPSRDYNISLHYHFQTLSGAQPAFYSRGTGGSFLMNNETGR
jgi:hypothetical protein